MTRLDPNVKPVADAVNPLLPSDQPRRHRAPALFERVAALCLKPSWATRSAAVARGGARSITHAFIPAPVAGGERIRSHSARQVNESRRAGRRDRARQTAAAQLGPWELEARQLELRSRQQQWRTGRRRRGSHPIVDGGTGRPRRCKGFWEMTSLTILAG